MLKSQLDAVRKQLQHFKESSLSLSVRWGSMSGKDSTVKFLQVLMMQYHGIIDGLGDVVHHLRVWRGGSRSSSEAHIGNKPGKERKYPQQMHYS